MNEYIVRYVNDVVRRLPENQREDVRKELTANILDMLKDDYAGVEQVLHDLGHPSEIAAQYKNDNRYLISPVVYDDFIRSLKIVMLGLGLLLFAINFIQYLIASINEPWYIMLREVASHSIGGFIEGAISGGVIVLIIFIIIEKYNIKYKGKKEWKLDELPQITKYEKKRINKVDVILNIIFTGIFFALTLYFLLHHQTYIGWYTLNSKVTLVSPAFSNEILKLIPFVIFLFILRFGIKAYKLTQSFMNLVIIITEVLVELISIVVTVIFLNKKDIIHPNLFPTVSEYAKISVEKVNEIYDVVIGSITLCLIIVMICIVGSLIYKIIKHQINGNVIA